MPTIPSRVQARLTSALRKFQPILEDARKRDVNEADTVTIVTDLLHDLFGYDKYSEVTGEHAIRGTFVDLAIKLEGKLQFLVEVKSIGTTLNEKHVKQAVDYGVNQGVEWVALTNAVEWHVYKITYGKPVGQELVLTLDLLALNPRAKKDLEHLWPLCKRATEKSILQDYHEQRQALNKYLVAAVLRTDAVIKSVRAELRRVTNVLADPQDVQDTLTNEVIKRELTDGEQAQESERKVRRAMNKKTRTIRPKNPTPPTQEAEAEAVGEAAEQ